MTHEIKPNEVASSLLAILTGEHGLDGDGSNGGASTKMPEVDVTVLQSALETAGVLASEGHGRKPSESVPDTPAPLAGPQGTADRIATAPRINKRKAGSAPLPCAPLPNEPSATPHQGVFSDAGNDVPKCAPPPPPRFTAYKQTDLKSSLDHLSPWEAARMIDDLLKRQLATAMCLQVSLQQVTAACMQAQGQFYQQMAALVTLNSAVQHRSLVPALAASIAEQRTSAAVRRKRQKTTSKSKKQASKQM